MQTGLYVALSSQMALEKRLNTLADNIANSNTVGFRATEVKFNQVLGDTKPTKVSYVSEGEEFLSTKPARSRAPAPHSISPSRVTPGSRSTRPAARR